MIEFEHPPQQGATLSPAGEQRREQILAGLHRELGLCRRRRRLMRTVGSAATLALVGAVLALIAGRSGTTGIRGPTGPVVKIAPQPEGIMTQPRAYAVVRDDPGAADRISVRAHAVIATIDDDELERTLRAAGEPSGLVRTGGRVYLARDFQPRATDTDVSPGT